MRKLLCLILCCICFSCSAETTLLHVTATTLNGRARPSKKAKIEAFWDYWDYVEATGEWSYDKEWVEVKGGENGTCWCSVKYLTEISDPVVMQNTAYKSVKIRSRPENGKVLGYLKKNRKIEITQVVLGWGKCKKGWIDMDMLDPYEED